MKTKLKTVKKSEDEAVEVETVEETPTEETPAEETKEEATEETTEEATETTEEESKEEEVEAKEEATEEVEAPEESEKETADSTQNIVKVDFTDFKKDFEKFINPITEKLATLEKAVGTLAKQAPTEGAADAEETPTEEADEAEEAEVVTPTEEVKKSDTSSEGTTDPKIEAIIAGITKSFEDRIAKLESQPAPSKVVVFRKGDEAEEDSAEAELTKIETRLTEIAKYRDEDPQSYARNVGMADEALNLIAKKRQLTAQN